jgi:hypothetical protein
MSMSQKIREEMLPRLRQRYANRGTEGRSRMITELCEQFGYSRKHAIQLLGAKAGWGGDPLARKGRPPLYGPQVVEVLARIWKAAEQPCGKRLVAMLALWLPYDELEHGRLAPGVRKKYWPSARPKWTDCWLRTRPGPDEAVAAPSRAGCSSTRSRFAPTTGM